MIKIKNATLISMSDKREKIENNIDILIDDNKIIKIGRNITDVVDKEIDATGKIVMPGLINTHSHVPMSIFKESADGYCLQDWLTKVIWPKEDKMTNEDVYYASILSFLEMIKTGTTTINDMYFMTDDIIKAALDTGVRLQTTRTLMSGKGIEDGLNRIKELDDLINKYNNKYDTITFNAGVHGLYTTNREYIKLCSKYAKEKDLLVHIHYCENNGELEDIKNIYNDDAINVLESEFRDNNLLLAHAVKLTDNDIERLSNMNASISHCPISNLKLGCGVAKISEMLKKGINITLGTDGQGSGCNYDLFEVMKFTALLQKGIKEEPLELPAYEVLKMATINGAKALKLDDKIGSIEEGKVADLIILDLNELVTQPINDILADIVYNVKGSNVDTTIINGKILMENKILKTSIDEKSIFVKCKEIIDRISA